MRADSWRRSAALIAVVLTTLAAGLVQSPPAHAATNRIAGVLTVGGAPVEGVELELMRWGGSEWWYGYGNDEDGLTDAAGRFSYEGLAPGTYTVTVHRRFPDGTTTVPAGPAAHGTVTIDIDDLAVLDVALPSAPRTVTGQVLQLDGTPAAGAYVELGEWLANDAPAYLFSTTADGDGRYALPLYDDEPHTVTAWTPGYLWTLLGDTPRFWEARTFGFGDGTALAPITLQSQYVGGLVTTAGGIPAPGRAVALLRWNHAQDVWAEVATVTTSTMGRYAFRNTGEGHFTVRLASPAGQVFPTTGFGEPVVSGYAIDQISGPGYRWVSGSAQVGDLDVALPPPPVQAFLRGTPAVGRSLRADAGASGRHYTLSYSWLRDGKVIPGATAPTYRPVAADGRHRISVRITAVSSFPGLTDQLVTSAVAKVRARSRLILRADPGERSARLAMRLRLPGTAPARTKHRVVVYVDGRRHVSVRLRVGGKVLVLRGLEAGRHRVAARFAGTKAYTPAQAVRTVRVR